MKRKVVLIITILILVNAVDIKIESLGTIVVTLKDLEASTEDYGKYTILMIDCE